MENFIFYAFCEDEVEGKKVIKSNPYSRCEKSVILLKYWNREEKSSESCFAFVLFFVFFFFWGGEGGGGCWHNSVVITL